ncbi:transcriptional regulator [Mycolicibacterium celeriflavum]|uniref:Rv0361 family membrane protein n=1 Tax=Mycolicibacterium celeriflavum TaxID=1249101 RepID=UPI003CF8B452
MRGHCAILAGLVVGFVVCPGASPALAAPASAAEDADQVRAVLAGMNGSYNREDFEAFAAHICAPMRRVAGFEAEWYASRKADGPTRIKVNSVTVAGQPPVTAVATVRFAAANQPTAKTFDIDFLREGTQWKACQYHPTRSI